MCAELCDHVAPLLTVARGMSSTIFCCNHAKNSIKQQIVTVLLCAELEKHIADMEILITTPFHPAYMTTERLSKAKKLKLIMTAGVGSDHIDLNTAADKGMTVVEVSGMTCILRDTGCFTRLTFGRISRFARD